MVTREERLLATQQAYGEWADANLINDGESASDELEAKLLDTMVEQGLIQPE
jgi:hypothetical protein